MIFIFSSLVIVIFIYLYMNEKKTNKSLSNENELKVKNFREEIEIKEKLLEEKSKEILKLQAIHKQYMLIKDKGFIENEGKLSIKKSEVGKNEEMNEKLSDKIKEGWEELEKIRNSIIDEENKLSIKKSEVGKNEEMNEKLSDKIKEGWEELEKIRNSIIDEENKLSIKKSEVGKNEEMNEKLSDKIKEGWEELEKIRNSIIDEENKLSIKKSGIDKNEEMNEKLSHKIREDKDLKYKKTEEEVNKEELNNIIVEEDLVIRKSNLKNTLNNTGLKPRKSDDELLTENKLINDINSHLIVENGKKVFINTDELKKSIFEYIKIDKDFGYLLNIIEVGDILYHINKKTKSIVKNKNENDIEIELDREINGKLILKLPYKHLGEWLFFEKDDLDKSLETLAKDFRYILYKNEKILEIIKNNYKLMYKNKLRFKKRENIIENTQKLLNMLEEVYKFDGPHHYTDIKNIKSILEDGKLYSRNKAIKNGNFSDSANQNIINHTNNLVKDQVRFYYKGKTPTLWANEGIRSSDYIGPHMPIPVLFLFMKEILFHEDVGFTYGGAGKSISLLGLSVLELNKLDWENIFSDNLGIKNIRNSEIWIKDEVDLKFVNKIVFRSKAEMKLARNLCNNLYKYNCVVNPKKFTNKHSYLYDYIVKKFTGTIRLRLQFRRDNILYSDVHKLEMFYENGFKELVTIENKGYWKEEIIKYGVITHKTINDGVNIYLDIYTSVIDNGTSVKFIKYYLNNCLCAIV